jgi:hypothetical protein
MATPPSIPIPKPGPASSNSARAPERISVGRPVDPPLVGAFHVGEIAWGRSSAESAGLGFQPIGKTFLVGVSLRVCAQHESAIGEFHDCLTLAIRNRFDTGYGTAPSFHAATAASRNATEFGRAMVTSDPSRTPSSAKSTFQVVWLVCVVCG